MSSGDRHEAALRAALAERDRLVYPANEAVADWVIESIVKAALAAADAYDGVTEPCPVVVGQQQWPGPGLFITCGEWHRVADHPIDPATWAEAADLAGEPDQ